MKILLIDDNFEIRDSVSAILELYNYDVTSCSNGREGLKLLSEQSFDVILLDLTMPDFSGFDFLEQLGNQKITSNNILTLSAMSLSDKQKTFIFEKGVKEIISKPIGVDELVKEIQKFDIKEISNV